MSDVLRKGLSSLGRPAWGDRGHARIEHGETGEVFEVDPVKYRLARMARRVRMWAYLAEKFLNSADYRVVMLTLTYREKDGWRANDIREFMLRLRERLGDDLIAATWVGEMQKKRQAREGGAPVHYHVLIVVPVGCDVPAPDTVGLWRHGMSKRETARTVWYIVKYLSKGDAVFPKGMRLFAVWFRKGVLSADEKLRFRLTTCASWLGGVIRQRLMQGFSGFPKRVLGGGWVFGDGEIVRSPYRFFWSSG